MTFGKTLSNEISHVERWIDKIDTMSDKELR